jgi:tRNA G18 (ribose-2'-O)-methylase SpoU
MAPRAERSNPPEIVLVLSDIRSMFNIGSMIRTADGFGVKKVFLCGYTATPDREKIRKTALGAERAVPWEKAGAAWRTVERLRRDGYQLVGLERCCGAAPIGRFRPGRKVALVVGNEVRGVTPALRRRLDAVVEIPMSGVKESFNVAVACGIALYALTSAERR